MGVNVVPPTAVNLADNPKNRLYRATQSGTYSVSIPVGVYEVTRQATTNIIIGSTTVTPSTALSLVFVNEPVSSITFNSTVSQEVVPWTAGGGVYTGQGQSTLHRINWMPSAQAFFASATAMNYYFFISTNGITWTLSTYYSGQGGDRAIGNVSEAPGQAHPYFGGQTNYPNGYSGYFMSSTDLRTWTTRNIYDRNVNTILANGLYASAYGAGRYLLAGLHQGAYALVVTTDNPSSDGGYGRWDPYYLSYNEAFNTAVFANGKFVVGGSAGSVFTSPDGTTWTYRQALFGAQPINKIVYAQNKFVAVGGSGIVRVSTDGITWERRTAGFNSGQNLTNLVYSEVEGVWAVGTTVVGAGELRISTDTVTWSSRTFPAYVGGYSLAYGNGNYVVAEQLDYNTWRPWTVSSLLTMGQTVPFTDTYIILEYKGKTKVLS